MPTILEPIEDVHSRLCDLWITWCEQNEISEISADDLLHSLLHSNYFNDDPGLTMKQAEFVEKFIELWEIEND